MHDPFPAVTEAAKVAGYRYVTPEFCIKVQGYTRTQSLEAIGRRFGVDGRDFATQWGTMMAGLASLFSTDPESAAPKGGVVR